MKFAYVAVNMSGFFVVQFDKLTQANNLIVCYQEHDIEVTKIDFDMLTHSLNFNIKCPLSDVNC